MSNVKEVLVGVRVDEGGKGELVTRPLMFAGPVPFIAPGIYTEDKPPTGWPWKQFLAKAIRHDGHGVVVVYEGQDKSAMRAVVSKYMQEAEDQMKRQKQVRDAMVGGQHPEEPKAKPKADAGGDK